VEFERERNPPYSQADFKIKMKKQKIGFIRLTPRYVGQGLHPQNKQPHLSLLYCVSILEKAGYESFLLDSDVVKLSKKDIIEAIAKEKAEIVFISNCMPALMDLILDLAVGLRENGVKIIALTDLPETLSPHFLYEKSPVDLMILGEMEETVKELVLKYRKTNFSKTRGIAYFDGEIKKTPKRQLIKDINTLFFPKHEMLIGKGYDMIYPINMFKRVKWGHIMASRGCPHKCVYCAIRVSYGNAYRKRSVSNLIKEIEYLLSKGVNAVNFVDDNFVTDSRRITDLCLEIIRKKLKFKWLCQTRPGSINYKLAKLMKKAGCSTVCLGIESGNNRILNLLNRQVSVKMISETFAALKRAGIWSVAYILIGNPTETEREINETYRLLKKLKPRLLQVAFFTAYPNSTFFNSLRPEIQKKIVGSSHYDRFLVNFSNMSDESLMKCQKKFYFSYLLNPVFLLSFAFSRMPYSMMNINREIGLMKDLFGYFFKMRSAMRGRIKSVNNDMPAMVQSFPEREFKDCEISIIVPAYNEEDIIEDTYKRIKIGMESLKQSFEIIFANDGSADNTLDILKKILARDTRVRVLSWNVNQGMGFAHRALYQAAQGDFVVQMDADLSTPVDVIPSLLNALKDNDVAIASRYTGVKPQVPLARKIASRVYFLGISLLFRLGINDTQSGFVAFRKAALKNIFLKSKRFEVHIELLSKLKKKGCKIIEIPSPYLHRAEGSKFSLLKDGVITLISTLRVWRDIHFNDERSL